MTDSGEPSNSSQFQPVLLRYQKLLESQPDDIAAQTNLAWSYEREKNFGQAVEEFRRALRIDPANTDAQFGLGLALLGNGQIEEALESFRRARKLADQSNDRGYTTIVQHHTDVFFRRYQSQS